MSLPDGKYLITSANPNAGHLDFAPYAVLPFPPLYFIVGSLTKDLKEQWLVTSTGGGTYTVRSTNPSGAAWRLRNDTIVAIAEDKADEFSIETAGEGVYTIRVPNNNLVATLESAGTEQLHVTGQDGTSSQLWKFTLIE